MSAADDKVRLGGMALQNGILVHSYQHWAVAAEDGRVTSVGSFSVEITGASSPHRLYRYLHLDRGSVKVAVGDTLTKGARIGIVSNNMGIDAHGKPILTSIHLHFEIRLAVAETGPGGKLLAAKAFVPPYTSLVDSYQRKLAGTGCTAH